MSARDSAQTNSAAQLQYHLALTRTLTKSNLFLLKSYFDVHSWPIKAQHTPVILHDVSCGIRTRIHDQATKFGKQFSFQWFCEI